MKSGIRESACEMYDSIKDWTAESLWFQEGMQNVESFVLENLRQAIKDLIRG